MDRIVRARRAGILIGLVCVLVLAFAPCAHAASTYFDQTPGVGAVTSETLPLISVKVSDPAGISTGYQLKVDGVSRTPKVTWGPNRSYCMLSYQQTSPLKNGTHTVYASVFTGAGRTSTTWTFTTRVAPLVGPLVPADGSTTNQQKPTVSAGVVPNGVALAAFELQVDGVPVVATYDAGSKTVSYTPTSNLKNDAHHTATLSVTDASGMSTSVTWGFNVQIYADMSDTTGCADCHVGFPAAHPMDDCMACHDGFAPAPAYFNIDPTYRHTTDYLADYDCTYCHSSVFPMVPIHTEDLVGAHVTTSDMSGCSCHVRSLTVEHARYLRDDGGAITCVSCHASADPAVLAGMASNSTACSACHTLPPGHPYGEVDHIADIGETADASGKLCGECHYMDLAAEHGKAASSSATGECATCHPEPRESFEAWGQGCSQGGCHASGSATEMHAGMAVAHTSPVPAPTCAAAGCHDGDVSVLHSQASTVTAGDVTLTSCSICHTPNTAPTKDCTTCHGAAPSSGHEAVHELERTDTCVACHEGPSLTAVHMTDAAFTCGTCHDSTDVEVAAAIASGTLACSACHVTQGVDYHLGMATAHRAPVTDYETCGHCHHGWGSNPVQGPDIGRHASCTYCHNDTFDLTGKTAHCADCHVTEGAGEPPAAFHRETDAFHSPLDDASMDCARCHETTNVRVLHAEPGCDTCHATMSCSECHSMHYASGGSLGAGLYCARCHETAGTDYHVDFSTTHAGAPAECAGSGCHTAASLVDVHAAYVGPDGTYPQYEDTCALCHLNDDPGRIPEGATDACASCHPAADHESLHEVTLDADCSGCHADANLLPYHSALGCTACHASTDPAVIAAIGAHDKRCEACHGSAPHGDLTATHAGTTVSGPVDVFSYHEGYAPLTWDVECGMCHATTNLLGAHASDCAACHNGEQPAKSFTAWNGSCSQGECHSGLAHAGDYAHNGLDCEAACHEPNWDVYYGSCDWCHNPVSTAPVTTSDVRATYVGPATVTFTGSLFSTTFYRLDGGPRVGASTVAVPAPATGSEVHTIEYWSVTDSGIEELPHKTASFTVSADLMPPVTTSNALASYVGPATITLSVTDNGTAPVANTYWRVDGGAQQAGRTAVVAQPASGQQSYTFEYWSVDLSGNEELPHNTRAVTITADLTPPVSSIVVAGGAAYTTSAYPTLTLSATDVGGSGVFQMRFSNDGLTWSAWESYAAYKSWWGLSAGAGPKTVHAQFSDRAGNVATVSDGVYFDGTSPTGTFAINGGAATTGASAVTLNNDITDAHSGLGTMRFSNDNVNWGPWEPFASTKAWTLATGAGSRTVYAQFRDNAGNQLNRSDSITVAFVETEPPTGSVSVNAGATYAANTVVTLTLSATDAGGSGVSQMRFSNDNVTWSSWQTYATSRSWTLASGDGAKTVYAQYRDAAGNTSVSYSDGIVLDATAPTGTVVINDGAASTESTSALLTLSASDGVGSGVSQMRFSNNGVNWSAWEPYAASKTWTLSSGNGTKTVSVQFTDVAGTASAAFSDTIELTGASVSASVTTLPITGYTWVDANETADGEWGSYTIYVNDVWIGTKYATDGPTWNCPEIDMPGGGHIDIVVDCGFDSFGWIFDEDRPNTFTITLPPSTVRLDAATWTGFPMVNTTTEWWDDYDDYYRGVYLTSGTIGNIAYSYVEGADVVPPTGSIAIAGGAAYTSSTAVTLNLSAVDAGGMGEMRFSSDNVTWTAWEPYATSKAWALPAGNGSKTVWVQYRDAAGNIGPAYSDGITLDGSAPTGSITIAGGAATTTSLTVTLNLSAADAGGSGLTQMRFSNDNLTWSTWQSFATSRSWTLSAGDGTKTVYVQYLDGAGNNSGSYSDTIDYTTPVMATLSFQWWGTGYAELHLENAAGTTIASTTVEGSGADLMWNVPVAAGQDYYMVCDYYYDYGSDDEGGGYGIWSNDLGINPDGVLSGGETVVWNY